MRKKEQLKSMDLSAMALAPTGDTKADEKRAKEYVIMLLVVDRCANYMNLQS
jgi:hypothetical protein